MIKGKEEIISTILVKLFLTLKEYLLEITSTIFEEDSEFKL